MADGELGHDVEKLKEDISVIRDDLTQITEKLFSKGKAESAQIKDKIVSGIGDEFESVSKKGKAKADDLENKVKEKPLLSILIAFIVGLLLGKLFDPKR